MAMSGLRELSLIATAPAHRLAVQTFIAPWDAAVLREAFARELARGGQVYFLHNEVSSIERMARELGELVPDARIRIAHGQMPERELESRSEEHTSELQSLMRISYAVFCLKKKTTNSTLLSQS